MKISQSTLGNVDKVCARCGVRSANFGLNHRQSDGLKSYCRPCCNEVSKRSTASRPLRDPEGHALSMARRAERARRRSQRPDVKARVAALRNTPEHKAKDRDLHLRVKYGITSFDYEVMTLAQGGVCAICVQPETRLDGRSRQVRPLSVDHNHATGAVRGLLCSRCNLAIGRFDEMPGLLRSAADYIERHS